MKIPVQLPARLSGSMEEEERLNPVSLSIEENMTPLSTAQLELPPGESVGLRDFVRLYTAFGDAGVYRVASVRTSYTGETSAELEHGICVLGDAVLPGEGTLEGTPAQIVSAMLEKQTARAGGKPMWKLGTVEKTDKTAYEYNNDNVLSAILALCESIGGCMLSFDQSAFPWTLHILNLPSEATCEGRLSRNLSSVSITKDDDELCTRMIAEGLPDPGYLDGPGAEDWGIVCKTLSVGEDVTQESLISYVNAYLKDHKDPRISVEISALDLSAVTGESIDRFKVGRIFRLALPDSGVTVEERILSVHYSNVYDDPMAVQLELANNIRDTADTLVHIENSTSGGVSQNSASKGYLTSRAGKITQTAVLDMLKKSDTYITENEAWTREAGIEIESNKVDIFATKTAIIGNAASDPETIDALLRVTSDNGGMISAIVGRKSSAQDVSAALQVIGEGGGIINMKANQSVVDGIDSRVSAAEINIDAANAQITLKASQTSVNDLGERVSAAEIDIDGANSQITLKANKVDVDALITEVNGLKTGGVKASSLYTDRLIVTNSAFHLGTYDATWQSLDVCTGVHYSTTTRYVKSPADITVEIQEIKNVWGDFETLHFVGR